MKCDEVHELIQLEVDDELSSDGQAPLMAHVAECEACAQFRNTLLALGPALEAACPIEVPADFTASVMAQVRRRNSFAHKLAPWFRPIFGTVLAYVVAGCAAYLFMMVVLPYIGDGLPGFARTVRLVGEGIQGFFEPVLVQWYVYIPPGMVAIAACVLLAGVIAWFMRDQLGSMPKEAEQAHR